MKIVTLKPRHDRPIRLRHPWVFSGAIASVSRDPALGETVLVTDAEGNTLTSSEVYVPVGDSIVMKHTIPVAEGVVQSGG